MTNEELVKRIDEDIDALKDGIAHWESTLEQYKAQGYKISDKGAGLVLLKKNLKRLQQARDAIPVWRSVKTDGLPEPGQRVACLRSNGSWDRGEYACLGSECLGEWYMPEGPVPCARWSPEEKVITHWMPLPVPPAGEVSE